MSTEELADQVSTLSRQIGNVPHGVQLKDYLKESAASFNRARLVLIVMITASVLAFAASWNSRKNSWLDARIQATSDAIFWLHGNKAAPLSDAEQESVHKAERYASENRLDLEGLQARLRHLQELESEQVLMVHVPFFGITFDVNDLGVLAGFTFVVVLLWFKLGLSRELSNLRLAFRAADREHQLPSFFNLMAMQQVLTLPPVKSQPYYKGLRWIPKLLFLLPLLVQLRVFWYDWSTKSIGESTSEQNTNVVLRVSGLLLGVICLLTLRCISVSLEIDREWESTYRRAHARKPRIRSVLRRLGLIRRRPKIVRYRIRKGLLAITHLWVRVIGLINRHYSGTTTSGQQRPPS